MTKQQLLTLIRALEKRIDELEKRPKTETHTHYHNYPRYPTYQSPGWGWNNSDRVYASGGLISYNNLASSTSANGSSDGESS